MAKKIQLQDASGNVLHPLTLGECVTMDNGENLDTLMSKSQMFTPTITQDKSMFKVGTGVDVDYSANVKDGAYESLVFKGKSLVNLMPAKTVFEKQAIGGTSGWRNSYLPLTQELKTNTIYTLFYKLETETKVQISIGGKNSDAFLLKSEPIREVGTHYVQTLLTTKPETSNSMSHLYMQFPDNFDVGTVKATNMVLLEGNYMDFNVPYFEGLGSCKMPILRNVGKNLFDGEWETGSFNNTTGVEVSDTNTMRSKNYIQVKPNKEYTLDVNAVKVFYDMSYNIISINKTTSSSQKTFTTPNNCYYMRIRMSYDDFANGNLTKQLEESPTPTAYEDHKTNILHTSEEIVLRSLPNGVCDTYNVCTGEYTQRVGEKTYTSTNVSAWWKNTNTSTPEEQQGWVTRINGRKFSNSINDKGYCNSLLFTTQTEIQGSSPKNYTVAFDGWNENMFIVLPKSVAETTELFQTYLQSNPITVQYELAEPITTIIKPSTMTPFAYQNGHVVVESGFEGQSLLPEIEYSVVTGRTGQVTQNTKVLRKQEQQIIGLEELLLTQVVQMEYERTLLQFDYELQMMMLG